METTVVREQALVCIPEFRQERGNSLVLVSRSREIYRKAALREPDSPLRSDVERRADLDTAKQVSSSALTDTGRP